jgi:hypothetical protein
MRSGTLHSNRHTPSSVNTVRTVPPPQVVVLTEYTVKNTIFWDVMPCSLVEVYRHFGRTYCLHLHGKSLPSNQQKLAASLLDLLFNPEDGGSTFTWNVGKLLPDNMASHTKRQYSHTSHHPENLKSSNYFEHMSSIWHDSIPQDVLLPSITTARVTKQPLLYILRWSAARRIF